MLWQIFFIFLTAFLGGMGTLILPSFKPAAFSLLLVFVGSYLLSLSILHLLPELFITQPASPYIRGGLLIGFFLQLFLDMFSKGVEHGHIHETKHRDHIPTSATVLLISLSIHAFLDGVILSNTSPDIALPTSSHRLHHHLLVGIVLHKLSETFALVSVLKGIIAQKTSIVRYLLAFSIASPVGLWISQYGRHNWLIRQDIFGILAALAVGNLLHIATTILFESNPHHGMNLKKCLAILSGISLVLILEYFL